MGRALDLLEAEHDEAQAHQHLSGQCRWYRHVGTGGREEPDRHCRPAGTGHALAKFTADGTEWLALTPLTPEASTVPKPTVPPGGPGLFHIKGRELPPYIQHVWHHLAARYGKHRAYAMAVGVVKKWAAGVHPGGRRGRKGGGGRVHADVQAAAAKNVAEWEKDKADARRQSAGHEHRVRAAALLAATAPGAAPAVEPRAPGTAVSNRPPAMAPRPPQAPPARLPTAAEVRALSGQVPPGADALQARQLRLFLATAAGKLERNDSLAALAALRSAQTAVQAAHKTDQGQTAVASHTALVFAGIPPAERSSATAAMLQGRERTMAYRRLELAVTKMADQIRLVYFRGRLAGPLQEARIVG